MNSIANISRIFLHPGEYAVGGDRSQIRTLLGSCVAITLWHPVRRVGAMSHFLLPSHERNCHSAPSGRYGDEAVELMLYELTQLEIVADECQAKIFGGGNMFPHRTYSDTFNVGQRNGEIARRLMHAHRIPIVSECLFGVGHRQIVFDVGSGNVWARQGKLAEFPIAQDRNRMHEEAGALLYM